MSEHITGITAEIVSAYVRHNRCDASEIKDLLANVYGRLVDLEKVNTAPEPEPRAEPAISVKKSVTGDAIYCLNCGKGFKTIKRHLFSEHGMTVPEYKAYWDLPQDYPTTAANYSETRSGLATAAGLGRKREPEPVKAKGKGKPVETAIEAKGEAAKQKAKAEPTKAEAPKAEQKVRSFTKAEQTRKKAPYDPDKDFEDDQEAAASAADGNEAA